MPNRARSGQVDCIPKKTLVECPLSSSVIRVWSMPSGAKSRSAAKLAGSVPVALRRTASRDCTAALL
jgi:hypothetical protein